MIIREPAHGVLGNRRYKRYCDAFDRINECVAAEYYLEAIAILESLMWDRLSSRVCYQRKKPSIASENKTKSSGASKKKKDEYSLNNLTMLCKELVGEDGNGGSEDDSEFRAAVLEIKKWLKRRNEAIHATAKVLRDDSSEEDFTAILKSHKSTARDGIGYLQHFDSLDTASRSSANVKSASFPNAFFPERRAGGRRASSNRPFIPTRAGASPGN